MHWKKNYCKILYVAGKNIWAVHLSLVSVSLGTSLVTEARKLVTLATVKYAYLSQNNKKTWGLVVIHFGYEENCFKGIKMISKEVLYDSI